MAAPLTVCIPYYRAAGYIRRAVESCLAQTFRDFVLVVIGDGEAPPDLDGIRDDRLVVYTMPANRGRYFCDAVAFEASNNSRYYAQHDADDWSEPERLETLMSYRPGAVAGQQVWHQMDGSLKLPRCPYRNVGPVAQNLFRFNHAGIYARERIERAGGYHPGFRMSYDTFLVSLMFLTGPAVRLADERHYHRVIRPDSLTRDPATALQSPARAEVRRELARIYADCWRLYKAKREREIPERIRRTIDPELRAEVTYHADQLRRLIA